MNGLNLLQQYIKEQELTGAILLSPINLHYFAGFYWYYRLCDYYRR